MSKRKASGPRLQLALIRHIVRCADPIFVAVFGVRALREIRAICAAVAMQCGRRKVYAARRIWLFHDKDIAFEKDTHEALEVLAQERFGKTKGRPKPNEFMVPFDQMVMYSHKDEWANHITALVTAGADPFGIVCHFGRGAVSEIREHLGMLAPLLTDTTLVAIQRMHQGGASGAYDALRRDGWSGVTLGTLGLLQRSGYTVGKE